MIYFLDINTGLGFLLHGMAETPELVAKNATTKRIFYTKAIFRSI